MKPELLEYDTLSEFDYTLRKDILDLSNISNEGVVHIKKLITADEQELENFWGWQLVKGSESYLFPQTDDEGNILRIKDQLPFVPTQMRQVSNQGKVFNLIVSKKPVHFKSENKLTFKGMVDWFDMIPHTNHKHRKLLVMMALTQMFSRSYFRLATPPGFGKDSINDTLKHLIGRCGTITNPTVARLEQETVTTDWLAITEITKIPKTKWAEDELFLLDCAAHKPSTNKRSKGHGIVGDTLSLKDFSISLFYNDLTNSRDTSKYIDFFADDQLLDRFIPMRLYGTFNYTFEKSLSMDIPKLIRDNKQEYMDVIYTLTYFKNNFAKIPNKYDTEIKGIGLSNRQLVSAQRLFKTISFYSDTQEEYDYWIDAFKDSVIDYRMMINYPSMLEEYTKGKNVNSESYQAVIVKLLKLESFTERIKYLDAKITGKPVVKEEAKEWW